MRQLMIQNSLKKMTLFETEKYYRIMHERMRKTIYFGIRPEADCCVVITLAVRYV